MIASLELSELRRIAQAKSVRGRLCMDEFTLPADLLANIQKLVTAKYGSVPKDSARK